MAEIEDNYDDELELEEQESEPVEAPKKEAPRRPAATAQAPRAAPQAKAKEALKERYVAIHQPERIVIVDNKSETVQSGDFKDVGVATALAQIMNALDRISISLGV